MTFTMSLDFSPKSFDSEPLCITQEKREQTNTFNWLHKTTKVEAHDDNILFSFFSHLDNNVVTSKQMRKVRPLTLPDLWSGTMKLKIVLSPGAGSSTVMVVKSWKTKCKCQQNDLGMVGSAHDFKKIECEVKLYIRNICNYSQNHENLNWRHSKHACYVTFATNKHCVKYLVCIYTEMQPTI